jgi:hypothetical protein
MIIHENQLIGKLIFVTIIGYKNNSKKQKKYTCIYTLYTLYLVLKHVKDVIL